MNLYLELIYPTNLLKSQQGCNIYKAFTYTSNMCVYIYICMAFTASTPLRKETGVFKSIGHFLSSCFIGLKCHKYALMLLFFDK